MCGILALFSKQLVNNLEFIRHLDKLQHRGQDSCGINTYNNKNLFSIKGKGLLRDIFTNEITKKLYGFMGIGHVRYPTTGLITENEIQPFYINRPYGISLVHNGNIYNINEVKEYLEKKIFTLTLLLILKYYLIL